MDVYLPLLGTVCAVIGVGYTILRLLERHTLSRLPTIAELAECPLRRLYRLATRAERMRLRRRRKLAASRGVRRAVLALIDALKLMRMRELGWIPTRAYRGVRLEQALQRALRGVDDVIDADVPPTRGTREWFLAHMTRLLVGFADPRRLVEAAVPEDLSLLYTLRASKPMLGLDVRKHLVGLWEDYTPDALRIIAGETVADRATIERAHRAYTTLGYLGGRMLGLSHALALLCSSLDVANLVVLDNLWDLLHDTQQRRLSVSREELEEADISIDRLLESCASWEQLAAVPGLARWCLSLAEAHGTNWEQNVLPWLLREIAPHIKPRLARVWTVKGWRHRQYLFDRLRRRWQTLASTADPLPRQERAAVAPTAANAQTQRSGGRPAQYHRFPRDDELPDDAHAALACAPPGWLAIADIMSAAAATFDLPVSPQTRERWRRFWGCAWLLDQLLDESSNRREAQRIYRWLVSSLDLVPADLPSDLGPVLGATGLLKSALEDLRSRKDVIAGALQLAECATRKTRQARVLPYLRTVIEEDTLTASIATACMSDRERESPQLATFQRWCAWFVIFGGLRDAADDLASDHGKKLVKVKPAAPNRWSLRVCAWLVFARSAATYPSTVMAVARSAVEYRRAQSERPAVTDEKKPEP